MDNKNKFETEIDFLALPKTPSRLFGWIFPYYAVLFVIVGIYFIKNMNTASFNNVPAIYTDSLVINANVEVKKGGIMPAIDLAIISNPTNEIIENGKLLFKTNCASCHGEEGKGDGVAAAALNPAPRNFHSLEGWTKGPDFNNMFTTLVKGITGTGMIGYDFILLTDRIAIIHYVRTLADYPSITEQQVADLDNVYELSKGVNFPSNITLEMAAAKISEEAAESDLDYEIIISKINSMEDKHILELFNKTVKDKEKVISIFKREFSKNYNVSDFINRVVAFPIESGFKPNVSLLSPEELGNIYKLLNNSIG